MNKKQLIERIEGLKNLFGNQTEYIEIDAAIELVSKLDEPQAGRADETPRYLRNVIERLRELPLHDREVWLKAIMSEFEQDFSHAKWREGYEQGKFEGEWVGNQLKDADKIRQELNKPVIPQFVADWIEKCKTVKAFAVSLSFALHPRVWEVNGLSNETIEWLMDAENQDLFARAWLDGYTVEEEKQYEVILCNGQSLKTVYRQGEDRLDFEKVYGDLERFTRKQLEEAGFSWVFDCPGIEIEEVE